MKSDSDKSETVTKPEAQGTLAATACSASDHAMLTDYDIEKIEALIKKHKPEIPGHTWIFIMALMFLGGCFRGCGY